MKFISVCCVGEKCFCGMQAEHKVEETIFDDDPMPHRHPLTAYICHDHFRWLMGPAANRPSRTVDGEPVENRPPAKIT